MMERIRVWAVTEDGDGKVRAQGLAEVASTETEQRLEELLVASPELLLDGLSLIGRQLPSEGGILDLLGIDPDGRLVLLELKRGTLTRDAVAQILDYASDLTSYDPDQLARLIEGHSGKKGIDPVEDFTDWYAREFPNSQGVLEKIPRMVLVGLGVDSRAKRIVNFLAESGVDIQLLTFHAFRSGGSLFLAKQVETTEPVPPQSLDRGITKEESKRILLQLAERQGAKELLKEVADLIQIAGPFYRWPGKTAYSFSLPETTEEGRPTSRSYLTLWVQTKKRGTLLLTFAPRAVEACSQAIDAFLAAVPSAHRNDSSWKPVEVEIDVGSWASIKHRLEQLLAELVMNWQRESDDDEALREPAEPEYGGTSAGAGGDLR